MAYCSQTEILDLISAEELANLTAESGDTPDDAVITEAIMMADALIDGYLGIVYKVPLTPTPNVVKSISIDISIYHIFSRRSFMKEIRRVKYEDWLIFLKDVAAGRATIGPVTEEPSPNVVDFSSADRVFSRETLGDF
jgi:phage gp36-like protein